MLIIFDKDGTLVATRDNHPANALAEQEFLPGVVERCAALRAEGHTLAIATNQGGVAFGYFTAEEAHAVVAAAAEGIGARAYAICLTHPQGKIEALRRQSPFRKPNAGMLHYLMDALGFAPADTLYVGDREEDRRTAQQAGVRFEWADAFFGRDGSGASARG